MNKFFNKIFIIGFGLGILVFIAINYYTAISAFDFLCFDCYQAIGFPFSWYEFGTIAHINRILWLGLIADILLAIIFSFIVGLIFKYIWTEISPWKIK